MRARSRLYRSQILQVNIRWKALAEIYTMHSFAPFSNLNFSVKILRIFRQILTFFAIFSMILLDFFEILLKFRWNFWKFHGNPLNLQISMNFRGCRTKPRPKCGKKPSAARFARPLRGVEVLVAVRGPSPGEGGGKKTGKVDIRGKIQKRRRMRKVFVNFLRKKQNLLHSESSKVP